MEHLYTLTIIVTVYIAIVAWSRINHWTQRALNAEADYNRVLNRFDGLIDTTEARALEDKAPPIKRQPLIRTPDGELHAPHSANMENCPRVPLVFFLNGERVDRVVAYDCGDGFGGGGWIDRQYYIAGYGLHIVHERGEVRVEIDHDKIAELSAKEGK